MGSNCEGQAPDIFQKLTIEIRTSLSLVRLPSEDGRIDRSASNFWNVSHPKLFIKTLLTYSASVSYTEEVCFRSRCRHLRRLCSRIQAHRPDQSSLQTTCRFRRWSIEGPVPASHRTTDMVGITIYSATGKTFIHDTGQKSCGVLKSHLTPIKKSLDLRNLQQKCQISTSKNSFVFTHRMPQSVFGHYPIVMPRD